MINLRTKKWWWPLFCFGINVSVNNAFQIYRERDLQPGEIKLDLLVFWRSIAGTYFLLFHNKEASSTLHRGNRSFEKVPEEIRADQQKHWIVKDNQRRCAMRGNQETLDISAKNAMLDCIQNVLRGTIFNKERFCI